MHRIVITATLTLALSACADAMAPGAGPVATAVAVAPAPNAASVARADTIRMWLDMPMDSASCVPRFTLHLGDSTGALVPGRMIFGEAYREMMFVPDSLLQPDTRYFAHMRDSVMMRPSMHENGMGETMMGGSWMMMTGQLPSGAVRMGDGMGWAFTTGS